MPAVPPPPDPPLPVFVYGTLRPGAQNWPVVARWCVEDAPGTLPHHRLYHLDHPAVVGVAESAGAAGDEAAAVIGSILSLHPAAGAEALAELDAFEGFVPGAPEASYYVRERRTARDAAGAPVDVWVYLAGPASLPRCGPDRLIASGDWFAP